MDAFANFDLNLLRALDALLRERSVTRAAHRLGLSQPAMSHALARLREAFEDELLVRVGREMVLTPRAEQLRDRASLAVDASRAVFDAPEDFDPAELRGQVTIATNDYAEITVLPDVVGRIVARAPGLDIVVRSIPERGLDDALGSGTADLALLIGESQYWPQSLMVSRLSDDAFVCVVRHDHPVLATGFDLAAYCALPHVLISRRGDQRGVVDEHLKRLGLVRRVAYVVPAFQLAPAVVMRSDAVLTVNRRYVVGSPNACRLAMLEPPLDLPKGTLGLLWHARTQRDPAQRWIRAEVAEGARAAVARLDNPESGGAQ